jgi:hypothetical protein
MTNREVTKSAEGEWLVNDEPLRFYHFSGFGHDFTWADRELAEFGSKMDGLRELWSVYKVLYGENLLDDEVEWYWGISADGTLINSIMRQKARSIEVNNPFEEI